MAKRTWLVPLYVVAGAAASPAIAGSTLTGTLPAPVSAQVKEHGQSAAVADPFAFILRSAGEPTRLAGHYSHSSHSSHRSHSSHYSSRY